MNLVQVFEDWNQRYFEGRLSEYRIVIRPSLPSNGFFDRKRRRIILRNEFDQRVLLHEMAHQVSDYHGLKFMGELKRLIDLGAPGMQEEYDSLKKSMRAPGSEIAETIETVALDTALNPRMTWADVRRYVAREMGMTAASLDRKYPWAKATWRNERREAMELNVPLK